MGYQFQSVGSVSPSLVDDLGIGYGEVGTLIGLYMLPGVVIALLSGVLAQRFGDKRMSGYGLALMTVGGAMMGLSESYGLVFAGRLLSGVGAVLFNVVITKMVTDWFAGREVRTALGIMLSTWPLGIALGLVTQTNLADAHSWVWVMFVASAACLLSLAALATVYRPPPDGAGSSSRSPGLLALPRRDLIGTSIAGIIWGTFNIGFALFISFAPGLLMSRGTSTTAASSIASVGMWVTLVSVPLGGYLAERTGRSNTLIVTGTAAGALALGLLPFAPAAVMLSALLGVGIGAAAGIMALPAQVLGPKTRGPGLGVFYTWYYLGMAIGPAVAGLGRDLTGSPVTPVLIGALTFAAVVPLLAVFQLHQTRGRPTFSHPSA